MYNRRQRIAVLVDPRLNYRTMICKKDPNNLWHNQTHPCMDDLLGKHKRIRQINVQWLLTQAENLEVLLRPGHENPGQGGQVKAQSLRNKRRGAQLDNGIHRVPGGTRLQE